MWLLAPFAVAAPVEAPPSVAVLDLQNATGDPALDGAGPGVAGLLVARFTQTDAVRVVEREALQAVLQELKLSASGLADPESAARTGRLVGARYLVTGELFSVKLPALSIALRIIDTETGEVVVAREVAGEVGERGEQFFTLVDAIAGEVLAALGVHVTAEERAGWSAIEQRELEAVIRYGQALTAVALEDPLALYRDRSLDFGDPRLAVRWTVRDNQGHALPMPAFALRVGDREGADAFYTQRSAMRRANRRANWISTAVTVAGLGVVIGSQVGEDTQASVWMGLGGTVLLLGGGASYAANALVLTQRQRDLALPGFHYTPDEADRWIADYNRSLR